MDDMKLSGKIHISMVDEFGNVVYDFTKDNLIVTAGKNWSAAALVAAATPFTYMAVGTSGTAPAAGDTALGAEIARVSNSSSTSSGAVATFVATFGAGVGTGTLQEAGLFNAASTGTMLSHVTYTSITKGASDTLTITWTVTQN